MGMRGAATVLIVLLHGTPLGTQAVVHQQWFMDNIQFNMVRVQ